MRKGCIDSENNLRKKQAVSQAGRQTDRHRQREEGGNETQRQTRARTHTHKRVRTHARTHTTVTRIEHINKYQEQKMSGKLLSTQTDKTQTRTLLTSINKTHSKRHTRPPHRDTDRQEPELQRNLLPWRRPAGSQADRTGSSSTNPSGSESGSTTWCRYKQWLFFPHSKIIPLRKPQGGTIGVIIRLLKKTVKLVGTKQQSPHQVIASSG